MISAKEAAEAMNALALATTQDQVRIQTERAQLFHDRLRVVSDHAANMARAKAEQDRMNAENSAYIKRERDKNPQTTSQAWEALGSYYANDYLSLSQFRQMKDYLPPKQERIMPWQLCRDDLAELRLWRDWKQLDDDVKREMLPPPCPSEMTQAFMDTNPAWKFRADGTLVASITDDAFLNATETNQIGLLLRGQGHDASYLFIQLSISVLIGLSVLIVWVHLIGFWQ